MIRYQSPNGYRGVLYGASSMMIYSPAAIVVLETHNSTAKTLEELAEIVDHFPETLEKLKEGAEKSEGSD